MNTCLGFIGVNIGMYAMRHLVGRRAILMIGATVGCLCHLSSAIASSADPAGVRTGPVLVTFTALFMFSYNACVGAASYPVATELVSSRLRAWTVGTATSLGYLLAWLTNFTAPYFINPTDLDWVSTGKLIFLAWNWYSGATGTDDSVRARNTAISGLDPISSVSSFSFSACQR